MVGISGIIKLLHSKHGNTFPITTTRAIYSENTGKCLDDILNDVMLSSAEDINAINNKIGNLDELTTTEKGSLVGAVTELNSQIPRVLYGNLYSSAVLRCTTLGTEVEKSFADVDINNVNAIGVNVAIPDIGRHFCLLPKLSTDAGPRCCFSYLGTVDYYVYGYVEVDWKNKKIKFLIKSLKGWDISLIYVSHIFLFQ